MPKYEGEERRAPSASNNEKWINGLLTFAVPIILLGLGSLTTWIWKVDDRQYQMSNDIPTKYASKADLEKMMLQFGSTVNVRFDMIEQNSRDQRNDRENFQNQVLQEVKETNKNVQDLALKLEKRTRG